MNYESGVEKVLELMRADYIVWSERSGCLREELIPEYEIQPGRSYDKVVMMKAGGTQMSAAGFIVKKDTKKFRQGDLLMSAGWSAPATNFARGNLDDLEAAAANGALRWTGIQ